MTVTAVPLRLGKTIAHWDMRVHDDDARLVAVARLTLAVRDPGGAGVAVTREPGGRTA